MGQSQILTEMSCRVCFITCWPSNSVDVSSIADIYYEITGHTILTRDIPQKLCEDCHGKLLDMKEFKQRCNQAEVFLEKMRQELTFPVIQDQVFIEEPHSVDFIKEEPIDYVEVSQIKTELDQKPTRVKSKPMRKRVVKEAKPVKTRMTRRNLLKQLKTETDDNAKVNDVTWNYADLEEYLELNCFDPSENQKFVLNYTKSISDVSLLMPNEDQESYNESLTSVVSCTYCSFQGVKEDFTRHFYTSYHERKFRCSFGCKRACLDLIRFHMTGKHSTHWPLYRLLQCRFCQFKCSYEMTLVRHNEKMHAGEILEKCVECGVKFYCDDLKLQHLVFRCNRGDASVLIPFKKILGRPICFNKLSKDPNLRMEREANAPPGKIRTRLKNKGPKKRKPNPPKSLLCELCGKYFTRKHLIEYHIETRHKNIRYSCDICGKVTGNKSLLARHMKLVHLGIREKHICTYCGKTFAFHEGLFCHIKRHHLNDYKYACDLCDKRFIKQCQLKWHKVTHSNACPFPCDECERSFKTPTRLTAHKVLMHDTEAVTCEMCNKSFQNKRKLQKHLYVHQPRKFFCPVCPTTFTQNHSLRFHVKQKHPEYEMPPPGTCLVNLNINELKA